MQAPQAKPTASSTMRRTSIRCLGSLAIVAVLSTGGGGGCGGGAPAASAPAASFSINVTPASAAAFADSGRVLTVTLARTDGYTADVTVALSNAPAGVTAQAVVFSGGVSSLPLSVMLDDSVAPGNLTLAFSASGGTSSAGTTAQLSVQAAQARAQQKIADALAASVIDPDTALLYRMYALAGDPRLPDAYVGSGSAEEDLTLFDEVKLALPQMSTAMQAALHPFLVRPDHPDSVYRRPGTTSPRGSGLSARRVQVKASAAAAPVSAPSDCVAGAQWRSVRSATIPVRVWSECYDDDGATAQATANAAWTMGVFEKIWAPMTMLMGPPRLDGDKIVDANGNDITDNGGDDAIDVYIVDSYSLTRDSQPINTAAVGSAIGFATATDPCILNSAGNLNCTGYFVLPASAGGTPFQRSTIIHEFLHVLQFAHNASLKNVNLWFYEASARWVESHYDRVLTWPERVALTKVHRDWFKKFSMQDLSLDATTDAHPYASYIWPFFLEQETGGPDIIGKIWTALESAKTLADEDQAIDAAYGFDVNFHRFALRNVNEALLPGNPVPTRYIDLAGTSDGVKQFPDGTVTPPYLTSTLVNGTVDTRAYQIEPLFANYAQFLVDRATPANRVEFDFSGLSNRSSLKLDALIRATTPSGEEWVNTPVPFDPESKAVFCFLVWPSTSTVRGQFTELRLVLSNSSRDTFVSGNVVVRPTNEPCGTWGGTINGTEDTDLGPGAHMTVTSTTQVVFEFDPTASAFGRQVFRAGSGTYDYKSVTTISSPPCQFTTTASGPIHPQVDLSDQSDGAVAGTLNTFVSAFGTPQYTTTDVTENLVGYATFTTVSNCGQPTTVSPASLMELWLTHGDYDITVGGTTMQDTYSFPNGGGTTTYTWLLTKQAE